MRSGDHIFFSTIHHPTKIPSPVHVHIKLIQKVIRKIFYESIIACWEVLQRYDGNNRGAATSTPYTAST